MYLTISVTLYQPGITNFDTYVTSHDRGSYQLSSSGVSITRNSAIPNFDTFQFSDQSTLPLLATSGCLLLPIHPVARY
jgi:hypothetical protein